MKVTKEIRIALVAIVGIVLLFFGMNFLKGVRLFASDNTYYISFDNVKGLSGSSPVLDNGYKVGTVKSINYDYDNRGKILVEVGIDKDIKIPVGTTAQISSDLLGNVQIDLIMGEGSTGIVSPEGTISGMINDGALGQLKNMIPQIQEMLPKVNSILENVNVLLADPAIHGSLHNVEQLTQKLNTTANELNAMIAQIDKQVPGLMGKASTMLDNANNTMGKASTAVDNLANLDLEGSLEELEKTLNNLKTFTEKLNDNEGSLAAMLNDRSLYDNLNATIAHADSLMVNLRENPKRYVHFSVFGKKNK
ncbi:MAG: MCE family protein [Prevotella sp.]|nr:MCE family protein [Prevotella sp.]